MPIPRLSIKMGEKDIEKWKVEEIEMQKKEDNMEIRIRNLKKQAEDAESEATTTCKEKERRRGDD